MARKPPSHLYGHSITLRVCTGVDTFQNPLWREYAVEHVNLQASTGTTVTAANTDASMRSLQVLHGNEVYTVEAILKIEDEYCRIDHWEVEMV